MSRKASKSRKAIWLLSAIGAIVETRHVFQAAARYLSDCPSVWDALWRVCRLDDAVLIGLLSYFAIVAIGVEELIASSRTRRSIGRKARRSKTAP